MEKHNRLIINDCEAHAFLNLINRLKKNEELKLKKHKPAGAGVFQERYTYTSSYEHISIVYETKSKTLIITAADHILLLLKSEYTLANDADKNQQAAKNEAHTAKQQENTKEKKQILSEEKVVPTHKKQTLSEEKVASTPKKPTKQKQKQAKTVAVKTETKPAEPDNKSAVSQDKTKKTDSQDEKNGGYSIKKVSLEKLEEILKQIKAIKGISYQPDSESPNNSKSYTIRDAKNKAYLRYFASRQSLLLQGKKSPLLTCVQALIQGNDYIAAVSSHIELTGEEKKAKELEKMLKKLIPNAFEFLSEQSRIDFTIGMMDIKNDEVKLSDYSMLLVPPYRGLERLIFDLQQAQSLNVKMIGQAYEKTDGKYVLKAGYRKRVGSIVYAEVMSALYIEYFEKRNFYAHSDITGDRLSRVITDKESVRIIFDNLIELIEYNIKKLKEIGFSM